MSIDTCFGVEEIIPQKEVVPTGCVIFLHGTEQTGLQVKEEFLELVGEHPAFSRIKFIFPTARNMYCDVEEKITNCWFNVTKDEIMLVNPISEDLMIFYNYMKTLVRSVVNTGIPPSRIIIGSSLGAWAALLIAYKFGLYVKGIASLSGFYPCYSWQDTITGKSETPESLHIHYTDDHEVQLLFAKISIQFLATKNIACELQIISNSGHKYNKEMLTILLDWIKAKLPDI